MIPRWFLDTVLGSKLQENLSRCILPQHCLCPAYCPLNKVFCSILPVANRSFLPSEFDFSNPEADFNSVFPHLAWSTDKPKSPSPSSPPHLLCVEKVIQKSRFRNCCRFFKPICLSRSLFSLIQYGLRIVSKKFRQAHIFIDAAIQISSLTAARAVLLGQFTCPFHDNRCSPKQIYLCFGRTKSPAECILCGLVIDSAHKFRVHLCCQALQKKRQTPPKIIKQPILGLN